MEGTYFMNGLKRRVLLAAITAMAMTGALAAPASAGILTASATDCGDETLTQPFAQFGDRANYKLVRERRRSRPAPAAGRCVGGAKVVVRQRAVEGRRRRRTASRSSLPAGSSAISPVACVGLAEPTLRFFAKKNRAPLLGVSTLAVSVYVKTSLGLTVPVPVGVVLGNGQWKPTPPMLIVANLLPLLPGRPHAGGVPVHPGARVTGRSTTCTSIRGAVR